MHEENTIQIMDSLYCWIEQRIVQEYAMAVGADKVGADKVTAPMVFLSSESAVGG